MMFQLFQTLKKVFITSKQARVSQGLHNSVDADIAKLDRTIVRLNSAKNVHLFRTDYLE